MATQQQTEGQGGAFEPSELQQLLNKEFKPRSDAAKEAVESAVRTLAEQALSQTTLISADAVGTIEAIIDRKSTRLNSSHPSISYAVFCLKKKNIEKVF